MKVFALSLVMVLLSASSVSALEFDVSEGFTLAQCNDGEDNDDDGKVDFDGGDEDCRSQYDDTEDLVTSPEAEGFRFAPETGDVSFLERVWRFLVYARR